MYYNPFTRYRKNTKETRELEPVFVMRGINQDSLGAQGYAIAALDGIYIYYSYRE